MWNAALWGNEDEGTQPEADAIGALSYLWRGPRGRLCAAYGCLAHRATPGSETFRSRCRGGEAEQAFEIELDGLRRALANVRFGELRSLDSRGRLSLRESFRKV